MKKPYIFIDCNSLNHLARIEFNRSKASIWLWKYFTIYTCKIVKKEFENGIHKAVSEKKMLNRKLIGDVVINPRYGNDIETKWLVQLYYKKNLGERDAGERQLICTLLEKIYVDNFPRSILVTDDHSAFEYFLNNISADIPFGNIWSSLDLILYVYLKIREITYQQAQDAIRDIVSLTSFPSKKYKKLGYTDEQSRNAMLIDYANKLKNIKTFREIFPG